MRRARSTAVILVFAAGLAFGCGPKRTASAPLRPGEAMVVLLPDNDGTTGRASVSNNAGSANLASPRDTTRVLTNQKPADVETLSEAEVKRLFGPALAALPQPPRRFTLFFRFESDELTDESKALLPEVLKTVAQRAFPDVVVVGHTDTMGTPQSNFELGLKRATMVRDALVNSGLDAAAIQVISLGKSELLVKTPDQTPEPRNRRVDVSVR